LNVVRGEQVVTHNVGEEYESREENAEPTLAECCLNVIGWSAVGMSCDVVMALVNLGEGGFYECRCCAEDGDDPHPENGAWTAEANGRRNADDVSCADAGGGRDHQSRK